MVLRASSNLLSCMTNGLSFTHPPNEVIAHFILSASDSGSSFFSCCVRRKRCSFIFSKLLSQYIFSNALKERNIYQMRYRDQYGLKKYRIILSISGWQCFFEHLLHLGDKYWIICRKNWWGFATSPHLWKWSACRSFFVCPHQQRQVVAKKT